MIFRIFITNSTAGKVAFCLHLWNIVILSIIVVVSAGVGCTNVIRPHNVTHDRCIFAVFLKTAFLDIHCSSFVLSIIGVNAASTVNH